MDEQEKRELQREAAEQAMNWATGWLLMHVGKDNHPLQTKFIMEHSQWLDEEYPIDADLQGRRRGAPTDHSREADVRASRRDDGLPGGVGSHVEPDRAERRKA